MPGPNVIGTALELMLAKLLVPSKTICPLPTIPPLVASDAVAEVPFDESVSVLPASASPLWTVRVAAAVPTL